jgi:Glycosyl transferase family 2
MDGFGPADSAPLPQIVAGGGSKRPCISFIIPVRSDEANLRRCLASIKRCRQTATPSEIIVIDNGSVDGSADAARQAGAVVLEAPGLRVGELRNRAARAARSEVLAFVDADHEIDEGWIRAALETLALPNVGGTGALCEPPHPGTWVQRVYGALRGHTPDRLPVAWLGAGNLAVRRSVFQHVGGFDTMLESCEDVDLCQRMRAAGFRLVGDARLRSVHFGDPSTIRALYFGELWRGRDNLRVSLRVRPTLAEIPSIAIPVVSAALLAGMAAGLLVPIWGHWWVVVFSVAAFLTLSSLRALRIVQRMPDRSLTAAGQALVVALVYDTARACALLTRSRHHRTQPVRRRA